MPKKTTSSKTDAKAEPKKTPKKTPATEIKTTAKPSVALSMDDLLQNQSLQPPKKGDIVSAKIVNLSKKGILFDIGWKSHAVLGNLEAQELTSYLPYLKEGDSVPVRVVVEEAKEGYPVVSMRSFFEKGKWDILEEKHKNEAEIEVVCGEYGKGGVFIEFMGIRGVIPKIQLTEELIREPEKLNGQKIKVKVLEVDREKNRLVVSQKASALGISYKDIQKKFDAVKVGETHSAKVIGFSDFGAFCEVNTIEGLIHISEISWQKVTDPRKHLNVGDEVEVVVVEKNPENLKLNLSIKRLKDDPWSGIEKRYPKDKEVKGTIIRKERYGYIVRLEPGVEGLIHVSKLEGREDIDVGTDTVVYIEKIDVKNRRISLILALEDKPVMYR
jgi:small subunit ribosomal protein S1